MQIRTDNFDTMRFIAAATVLFSHAVPITTGSNDTELLHRISSGQTTFGSLAVVVFFAMSGYLIAGSFLRSDNGWEFARARFLRIFPALAAVVVVTALAVGPSVSDQPWLAYVTEAETWRYIWRNLLMRPANELPGVFVGNPLSGSINGSLWTLAYEVECYAIILLLGVTGLLRRWPLTVIYGASLAASALWFGGARGPLAAVFLGGAMMRVWNIRLNGPVAGLCGLLWCVALFVPGFRLANATVGVYVVLYLALGMRVKAPNLARYGDVSYGVYLWAFPIQQCVTMLGLDGRAWLANALLSLVLTTIIAALSWHWIEKPCLAWKRAARSTNA